MRVSKPTSSTDLALGPTRGAARRSHEKCSPFHVGGFRETKKPRTLTYGDRDRTECSKKFPYLTNKFQFFFLSIL